MSSPTPPVPPEQFPTSPLVPPVDTRPKRLALTSLILAIAGLVFALLGFLPLPIVALAPAVIGGVLLLAGLIIAIIALASARQGGKGLAVGGLAISLAGGIVWVFALLAALLWTGLAAAGVSLDQPNPTSSSQVAPGSASSADQQAYLDAIRPEVTAILAEVRPGTSADQLAAGLTDPALLAVGQAFAQIDESVRDKVRAQYITEITQSSSGQIDADQAARFFDTVYESAQQYLR